MEHRGMKLTTVYYKCEYKVYKDCHSPIIVSL